MPVSVHGKIRKEDLKGWPYLDCIELPDYDVDIGLLKENNVPKAMEPWKLINDPKEDGPFTVKTRMGWIVHGSLRHEKSLHIRVNRVNEL